MSQEAIYCATALVSENHKCSDDYGYAISNMMCQANCDVWLGAIFSTHIWPMHMHGYMMQIDQHGFVTTLDFFSPGSGPLFKGTYESTTSLELKPCSPPQTKVQQSITWLVEYPTSLSMFMPVGSVSSPLYAAQACFEFTA